MWITPNLPKDRVGDKVVYILEAINKIGVFMRIAVKYYRLYGKEAYNRYETNFYRLLRCIGRELNVSNSQCFQAALSEIKKRVKKKGYHVTNSEIHNLIRAKIPFTNKSANKKSRFIVYRFSRKSHLIFEAILDILCQVEQNKNIDLSQCIGGNIQKGIPCRLQIVSDIDQKIAHIISNVPKKMSDEAQEMAESITDMRKPC